MFFRKMQQCKSEKDAGLFMARVVSVIQNPIAS